MVLSMFIHVFHACIMLIPPHSFEAQVGFGVASLPPQLVVLKKVTMKSWAAEQQLTAGQELQVELGIHQ